MSVTAPVLGLVALASAAVASAPASDVGLIAAARARSNVAIASHDAAAAVAELAPEAQVLASGGGTLTGRAGMETAFKTVFAQPDFITFARTPTKIETRGATGAESGRWVGRWRNRTVSGPYLARWRREGEEWVIVSETFVPTACRGRGCD